MTLNENTCGDPPVFSLDWQAAGKSADHLRVILCLQGSLSLRVDGIPLSLSACRCLACPAQAVLTDIELDFPNLSFFGRYAKKHLGISPRAYRERME